MKVGGAIFPLLLLGLQTCNSWSQQHGCSGSQNKKHPFRTSFFMLSGTTASLQRCSDMGHTSVNHLNTCWLHYLWWENLGGQRRFQSWRMLAVPMSTGLPLPFRWPSKMGKPLPLLPSDQSRVYTNVAWKHQKSTGLLDTLKTLDSLFPLCLHYERCTLHTETLPWIGAEGEWKESNYKTYSDWEWDQDTCKDTSGPA